VGLHSVSHSVLESFYLLLLKPVGEGDMMTVTSLLEG
jgi:hypothetical protein